MAARTLATSSGMVGTCVNALKLLAESNHLY